MFDGLDYGKFLVEFDCVDCVVWVYYYLIGDVLCLDEFVLLFVLSVVFIVCMLVVFESELYLLVLVVVLVVCKLLLLCWCVVFVFVVVVVVVMLIWVVVL